MDRRVTADRRVVAFASFLRSGDDAVGLFNRSGGLGVPNASVPRIGNDETSATSQRLRQRQILVDLLGSLEPDKAAAAADALLDEFVTLQAVLAAGAAAHARVLSPRPRLIRLLSMVRETMLEALRNEVRSAPTLGNLTVLVDYLRVAMAQDHHERVRVLFLDTANVLMRDEVVALGDTLSAAISPRDIMRRALELGSSALILAHNHPSGEPTPSAADIRMTRAVGDAGRALEIVLHDHIIVGRNGWTSMHQLGLI